MRLHRALILITMVAALLLPVSSASSSAAAVSTPAVSAPPDVVVDEAAGTVDMTVRLSAPGANSVSVHYFTRDGSAVASGCPADYGGKSGTLTFAPGEMSKTVPITINDCGDVESLESFTFNLNDPVNATLGRNSTRVEIADNDTVVATPRIVVNDAVVDERDGTALVSVLLGGPHAQASAGTVTVDYTTADGTATAPGDYTAGAGTLTFTPGQTAKTVEVPITDDSAVEPAERFTLELSNPTDATIADDTATITIGANDAPAVNTPIVSAPADVVVDEAVGSIDLVVRLSAPATNPVSLEYFTADGSAERGDCPLDYGNASGTLTFLPGQTTQTVRIDINDCDNVEDLESFTFNLHDPAGLTIGRNSTRVTIVDNDTLVAVPHIVTRDVVVDERDGIALVSVLLGGPHAQASAETVTVDYATADGTATAPGDYIATNGTLTFIPGQTAKTIEVPIADDGLAEGDETFTVKLSNPVNATIADDTGTVMIGANDAPAVATPVASAPPDMVVSEAVGSIDLVVRLSAPSANLVSVGYFTSDNTAERGDCPLDYGNASGTLTFLPGQTTQTVRIDINDCDNVEGLESFFFNLNDPENVTIGDAHTQVTIVDDTLTLTSIAVTPANASVERGDDLQLTATGTYSDAETLAFTPSATWSSSDPGIATVDAAGRAHGVAVGATEITAAMGPISGSTSLTVTQPPPTAQTITFAHLANRTFGDPDFTVAAAASSGLPVAFSAAGSCTIAGATVHLTSAGSCTVTASQGGNAEFAPAPAVSQTFSIARNATPTPTPTPSPTRTPTPTPTPTPSPTPTPTAAAPPLFGSGGVVQLPSTKRCVSRRLFTIHIRQRKGFKIATATVILNNKLLKVFKRKTFQGTSHAARVDLRGLPKGTFKVRIIVVATDGRVLQGTRTYHTCSKRKTPRQHPKV